ncbi:MAG: hypothetical protein WBD36_13140 [Bacteroidota bacterium]
MWKHLASLCVVSSHCVFGGGENNGLGTKPIALGNAFVAVADNAWAVQYNPAGLAFLGQWQVSGFVIPEQFGLPQLRTTALAATVPWTSGVVGFSLQQFGFDLYREATVRTGLAVAADDNLAVGLTLRATRFSIEGYGAVTRTALDAGILCRASQEINLGASLVNLTGTTIGNFGERLPRILCIGTSYQHADGFLFTLELEQDVMYPLSIKGGIQQKLIDLLSLRIGAANNPDKFTIGFSVDYEGCEIGYAAYSHLDLGWTHQFEVTFQLRD